MLFEKVDAISNNIMKNDKVVIAEIQLQLTLTQTKISSKRN